MSKVILNRWDGEMYENNHHCDVCTKCNSTVEIMGYAVCGPCLDKARKELDRATLASGSDIFTKVQAQAFRFGRREGN